MSEGSVSGQQDEDFVNCAEGHKAINTMVKAIQNQTDYDNCINHNSRNVYYQYSCHYVRLH